eukprot:2523900-Amphidinium_carterae.2
MKLDFVTKVPAWVRQEALPAPASTPTADGAVAAVAGGVTVRRSAGASGAKTLVAQRDHPNGGAQTKYVVINLQVRKDDGDLK